MDTHFEASPDLDRHDAPISARLPDEPDLDAADAGDAVPREKLAPVEPVRSRKHGRGALLGGAAIVGVCVVAGGVFVFSPYNHLVPVPAKVAAAVHNVAEQAGIKLERPLAPSATLASVALPDRPNAIVVPKYLPKGRNGDLSELLAIGSSGTPAPVAAPSSPRTAAPGGPAAAPDGPQIIPHEPGTLVAAEPTSTPGTVAAPAVPGTSNSTSTRPTNDITGAIIRAVQEHPDSGADPVLIPLAQRPAAPVSAAPDEPVRVASEPAVVAPVQQVVAAPVTVPDMDAASRAQRLLAGPMSSDEQVKVLELVTQMATMVRDQRNQIGALRADFAKTKLDDQARLTDFARRVDLAEATRAVAAATGSDPLSVLAPPPPTGGPNPVAVRPGMATGPISITRADMAVPVAALEAKHYRVQAASPGLALLTEVERGGGDGAQIQVIVGGSIPGYGRVKSITQVGSSWSVRTENGDIR